MKLAVISDVHGSLFYLEKALNVFKDVDRYVFLGDYLYHGPRNPIPKGYDPMKVSQIIKNIPRKTLITGNCDAPIDLHLLEIPEVVHYQEEDYKNVKFFFTHGWDPNVQESKELAIKHKAHFLVFGHTHIPIVEKYENLVVFNPGSVSLPKNDSPHSAAKVIIEEKEIILELFDIENKKIFLQERIKIWGY